MAARYLLLDLDIDLDTRAVRRAGRTVEVAGLSFDLLACLLVRGHAVVSFDELMTAVWAPSVVNEETITQRVKLLRQALGDDSRKPRYIRSVRGRGYQLLAQPRVISSAAAAPRSPAGALARLQWTATGAQSRLLLVLERIGFPAPWTSVWLSLVTVALVGTAMSIWSGYRAAAEPDSDLLGRARYYASIGQKDNNERAIRLYQQALQERPTLSAATLGLSFAYSSRVCLYDFAPQWLDQAESLAQVVLQAEPRNALAHAALGYAADCRGYIDVAIAEYEHALRLDPSGRRDTLGSLANLYQVKGRLVEALRSNLALSRSSAKLRYLDIQTARTLELLGFTEEAEHLYARSFRLYPDNVFSNAAWPQFLMTHGRVSQANRVLHEALARGTDRNDLQLLAADLALQQGDRRAAAEFLARARAMRPGSSFATSMALLYTGELPAPGVLHERIDAVQRSIAAGDRWPLNWLEIAVLQNALGDQPAAIAALRDAVKVGFLDKAYLESSAFFRPLNSEADFARLISEITHRVQDQRRAVLESDWRPGEWLVASR